MKTDKGITLAVIVVTIVAMFTLNFAMTRYGTPAMARRRLWRNHVVYTEIIRPPRTAAAR